MRVIFVTPRSQNTNVDNVNISPPYCTVDTACYNKSWKYFLLHDLPSTLQGTAAILTVRQMTKTKKSNFIKSY